MSETTKTSSYSTSHKAYYSRNRETILEKYRETKPYKAFYERNKERLRAKALERYYQKKLQAELNIHVISDELGILAPPANAPVPETPGSEPPAPANP